MSGQFTQLTPFFFTTQSPTYAATNSGIIIDDGQAKLIDPGLTPKEIAAIAGFVQEGGASVTSILLTHSHWDHILGPEHFSAAKIVAHSAYRETVHEQERGLRRALAEWEAENGIVRDVAFRIPEPDQVFGQTMPIKVGAHEFQLLHAPGHHADQFVVYQPGSGLLWAADMLSDLEIPFIEYQLRPFRRTLDMLAALDIGMLVPGHGNLATEQAEIHARIAHDQAYLAELESIVARCVSEGFSVEQTIERCGGMRFRHPTANADAHQRNVETAFLELGGAGDAATIGWGQYYVP